MTPKYFTSPAPIQPSKKGTTNTPMPIKNPSMLLMKWLRPPYRFSITPVPRPNKISQFGIFRTLRSKNAARLATAIRIKSKKGKTFYNAIFMFRANLNLRVAINGIFVCNISCACSGVRKTISYSRANCNIVHFHRHFSKTLSYRRWDCLRNW